MSNKRIKLVGSLQRLEGVLNTRERHLAKYCELSLSQLRLIRAVCAAYAVSTDDGAAGNKNIGLRVGEAALALGLSPSTMTRNLQVLERSGLVRRIKDPRDGRAYVFEPTIEGLAIYSRIEEAQRCWFQSTFERFHPSDALERAIAMDRVGSALAAKIDAGVAHRIV